MSFELHQEYLTAQEQSNSARQSQPNMSYVFVKGDIAQIQPVFEKLGGKVIRTTGGIVRGQIPSHQIEKLAQYNFVSNLQSGKVQNLDYSSDSDSILYATKTKFVHQADSGLNNSYTGKGVLVGIVDSGIDYLHDDFRNSDGTTRILKLWDFNVSGTPPTGFLRGHLYASAHINNAMSNSSITIDDYGHGTGVASLAAGNGNAMNGAYKGLAPEAHLLIADLTPHYYTSDIVDAVEYFFEEADRLNMPCVVNVSFGSNLGPHDGSDSYSQIFDALLDQKNGRAIVVAAGNSGDDKIHVSYPVTSDTSFTWFNKKYQNINFQLYAKTYEFNNVSYTIGVDSLNSSTGNYDFLGNLSFKNAAQNNYTIEDIYDVNGRKLAQVITYVQQPDPFTYALSVLITPEYWANDFKWRFMTTGSGTFNLWNRDGGETEDNPNEIAKSSNPNAYKYPDNLMSIGGTFNSAHNLITVGSCTMINQWTAYDQSITPRTWHTVGNASDFSSEGPTRDGRTKPEIVSPGQFVACSKLSSIALGNNVVPGEKHIILKGTSYASPVVAGAVALFLEAFPSASYSQIKDHLTNTAQADVFTGNNLPDTKWGYGKLDVLNFVKAGETANSPLVVDLFDFEAKAKNQTVELTWKTASETNHKHFETQRSVDGVQFETIDLVPGIGNSQILNYYEAIDENPITGKNYYRLKIVDLNNEFTFSEVLRIDFNPNSIHQVGAMVYPNPFQNTLNIQPKNWESEEIYLQIVTPTGQIVFQKTIANINQNIDLNLSKGIYFMRLWDDNQNAVMQKIIKN